jgi:ankyrin repeat protein
LALSVATNAAPADNEELFFAVGKMDIQAVRVALAHGADPNYLDPEIKTPLLLFALADKKPDIAILLLEHGADAKVELVIEEQRVPSLVLAAKMDDPTLIAKLIERGADPTATDNYGNTPLASAAFNGREGSVRALLADGVSANQFDGRGRTPLLWAVGTSNLSMLALLLENGADPNLAGKDGLSPMSAAKSKGNQAIISALRKAGAK